MTLPSPTPVNAAGEPITPQANGLTHSAPVRGWSPRLWENRELVAVQPPRPEDLDALIERFWSDPELQGLPHVYVGDNTVIVPAAVVDHLRRQGHPFSTKPVVSAGDLPPEEVNDLRRNG